MSFPALLRPSVPVHERGQTRLADDRLLHRTLARARRFDQESVSAAVIRLLDVRPEDAILELGCGSGKTLLRVAVRAFRGFVAGVDPCALQVRHARLRTGPFVRKGRVRVETGSSADLSQFGAACFDKVYAVHVVPFWQDAVSDLREVTRVLRPGGRLLLGYRPADVPAGEGAAHGIARVESWLREAGLAEISSEGGEDASTLAWSGGRR